MAGEDLLGPVELLDQEGADQQMGPGHGAKGQLRGGVGPQIRVQPVGAADQKGDRAVAGGAPLFQTGGETRTVQGVPAFVEGDHRRPAGQGGAQQIGLGPRKLAGRQGLTDAYPYRRRRQGARRTGARPV